MAYAKDKTVILEKMKELQTIFFSVTEPDGKGILCENDDKSLSFDDAYTKLALSLDSLEGTVKVILRPRAKTSVAEGGNNRANHIYQIRLGTQGVNGTDSNSGYLQKWFDSQLQMIKLEYEQKEKLRELEDRLTQKEDWFEKLMPHLMPQIAGYLPGIMQKMGVSAPMTAIAGHENDTIQIDKDAISDQDIIRLNTAITDIMKVDSNYIETIELLAKFAKAKPKEFLSFIPILKSQL